MTGALEFDRVARVFATPGGATFRALDSISLSIPAGRFVALVGPSGCGKSTLLHIAAGLTAPTDGAVLVFGERLAGLNRRATYMLQQDALLPWKTVRDNVALGLVLSGTPAAAARARADEWLARVGLSAFAAHFPAQLSGGMRKRVGMAQQWIVDRDLLLMDEPFSALDVHTRHRMETELLALWDGSNKTIVFVTHDLEEALALADEVVVLSAGPSSRVISRHEVPLPRPRDLFELRSDVRFVELYRDVWSDLRREVMRSQEMCD